MLNGACCLNSPLCCCVARQCSLPVSAVGLACSANGKALSLSLCVAASFSAANPSVGINLPAPNPKTAKDSVRTATAPLRAGFIVFVPETKRFVSSARSSASRQATSAAGWRLACCQNIVYYAYNSTIKDKIWNQPEISGTRI